MRRWLFVLTAIAGCAGPARAATDQELEAVVGKTVSSYVVPAYETLDRQAGALVAALDGFCRKPEAESRSAVDAAFSDILSAWAGVDFLRFGPMAQEARYERFAFWPDVHGTGARQLRQLLSREDDSLLQPETLAQQSAAVQGLPAIESLLYSGSDALMEAPELEAFRCALAVAISRNMQRIAAEAVEAWGPSGLWFGVLTESGPENPVYRSHSEAMTEVLRAALTGLEQLRDHRLLPPLGDTPEAAKASRGPYNASGRALDYFRASAAALDRFVEVSGMLELLPEESKWIAGSVSFEFANLKAALEQADDNFKAALTDRDRRQKLVYAAIVLASLRDLIQNQFAPAAGLTPGFNSLDGD